MRPPAWAVRLIAPVLLASSGGQSSDPTPSPALLVLAKTDRTLSIVNPATRAVVGRVPSGPDPHEVIASADGKIAYISNYGGGAYNTLTPVDLVQQKALPAVDLDGLRGPHGIEVADGKVWFTAEAAKAVGRYDPATRRVDWVMGTGQNGTHMLLVSPKGDRVVTTNLGSATVTIIEQRPSTRRPGGDWEETVIAVGRGAEGFDISPDGREVWVANAGDGTISIVDLASKRVVQTLAADVRGANRLKFTPDGSLVLVSTLRGPDLTVLNASTRSVVKRVPVGRGAAGILVQPDGALAYVACTPDDDIAVVDVKSLAVVGRIVAGKEPDGLAWAAR
ncbi:MAG: YVTN family beta-propeller repeat protein [Gemmatimonadaceae bacterium]